MRTCAKCSRNLTNNLQALPADDPRIFAQPVEKSIKIARGRRLRAPSFLVRVLGVTISCDASSGRPVCRQVRGGAMPVPSGDQACSRSGATINYDRDEIIPGSAKYGLAGIVGQLNKGRGLECNVRYMAEGAWNPKIQCRSFYEGYLGRIYGPDALEELLEAFLLLEENDKALGWQGRHMIFRGFSRFSPLRRLRRDVNYKEARLKLDREQVQRDIQRADALQNFWGGRAAHCRRALELLHKARPKVLPGALEELEYVVFKTENFISYFQVLNACQEAMATLDRAWLAKGDGKEDEFRKHLGQCQAALDRADRLARDAARQMIPYAHIPTEKYLLFRYNQNVIGKIEGGQKYLAEIIAFHKE